jgi:hypothetical protein
MLIKPNPSLKCLFTFTFRLNENWYFKLKDIKDLDVQTWKDMGLPVNLFNLLNKKVKEAATDSEKPTQTLNENKSVTISQNQQTQGKGQIEHKSFEKAVDKIKNEKEQFNAYKQMVSDNNNQQKVDTEKKIPKQMIEEENVDEIRIYVNKFLENIVNEIRDSTVYISIMKNLYTIIENIVKNPSEPKFRKIKAFGGFIEKSVAANESVMKFFLWVDIFNFRFLSFYRKKMEHSIIYSKAHTKIYRKSTSIIMIIY